MHFNSTGLWDEGTGLRYICNLECVQKRSTQFANSFHPVHAICVTIHRMAIQILTRRLFLLQNARVCAPYCL